MLDFVVGGFVDFGCAVGFEPVYFDFVDFGPVDFERVNFELVDFEHVHFVLDQFDSEGYGFANSGSAVNFAVVYFVGENCVHSFGSVGSFGLFG